MSLELSQPDRVIAFGKFRIDLSRRTHLMGILNVTPDSFSDGGDFMSADAAIKRGIEIEKEGADILDIGGESTRPGAAGVSAVEELDRILPVIRGLAGHLSIPISIDTSKAEVAEEALKAGAAMINNVMGADLDRRIASIAAQHNAPLVLMHIKGTSQTMQRDPEYINLISEVMITLKRSIETAEACGVDPQKIIIDPGIGFGKTVEHNLELIRNIRKIKVLHKPVMVGCSRKNFIGKILGIDNPRERLMGSATAAVIAIINGADIVRVHDVREMAQVVRFVDAAYPAFYKS